MPQPADFSGHSYIWWVVTVGLIVGAMIGGVWLLAIQTKDLKHAARNAACVSIANQNLQYVAQTGKKPPVPTLGICGASELAIIDEARKEGIK